MKKSLLLLGMIFLPWGQPRIQSDQGCDNEPEYYAPFCDDGNKIDGYWWYNIWVPGYIRNVTQFIELPPLIEGRAVWYAEGVMEAQVEWRGYEMEWFKQGYVDGVAAMSCADIGLDYWINRGSRWEGPFLVLDCPQTDDQWGIIVGREEVVEVGWATKERWGIDSPINVLVSRVAPSESIHLIPTILSDWYAPLAKFYPQNEWFVDLDPRPRYRYPRTWRLDGVNWVTYEQPTLADYDWPSESRWLIQLP